MKKFFILLLLLYPIQAFTQIKTGGTLEMGYENRGLRLFDDNIAATAQSLFLKNSGFADACFNANYKNFLSIYAEGKIYIKPEELLKYKLLQFEYTLGLNCQVKCFLFNVEHMRSNGIKSKAIHEARDKISVTLSEELFQLNCPSIKTGTSFEFGYENRTFRIFDEVIDITGQSDWLKNTLFTDILLNAKRKRFSIYGGVKTYFKPEKKFYSYNPLQNEYLLGIKYQIKSVSFRMEHMCSHTREQEAFYEVYDKLSVSINFGNKKFSKSFNK